MQPRYVYLDQNHWIYLAQDYWGKPHKPEHKGVAGRLLDAVESDRIRIPLSTIHFIEHLRAANAERRERLAQVFQVFSRNWHMASWASVLPEEIRRAVAMTFGARPISEPQVFGKGFLFGLGPQEKKLFLEGRTEEQLNVLQQMAALPGAILHMLTFPNETGRARQNVRVSELSRKYASASEALRSVRKPDSEDVHRRAQYAQYTLNHQDVLCSALAAIGRTPDEFLTLGLEGLKAFWANVPSFDVDCELTLYRDRQWSKSVDPNDVRDIGYLSLAIPYCTVVVTERFWRRAIEETGLARKYGTVICTDLMQMLDLI